MWEARNNRKRKNILSDGDIRIYRTLYLLGGTITPIFAYLWIHFQSNLEIISLVAWILAVYYISIYFLSDKNEYLRQRIHYFLYGSYYFVSGFVVYLGYINQFSKGYPLLLMLVIFYIILTFNQMSHLLYYLISTMVFIMGALSVSHLQSQNISYVIIAGSFIVFSIIAIFNLYLRIRFQRDLQESYEDYERLLDSSPDGIVVYEDMKIVYVNPVAVKMFDQGSQGEIIGLSIFELTHRNEYEEMVTAFERLKKSSERNLSERKIQLSNNKVLELEIASTVTTYKGKEAVMVTCKDISKRKTIERKLLEEEYKYRSLVEGALVGVYIYQNGKIIYVNPYIEELFDYSSDEVSHMNFVDLIFIEDRALAIDNIQKVEEGMEEAFQEFRIIKRNGNMIYVQSQITKITYNGQNAMIGTLADITERKKAEAKISYMAYHDSLTGLPNRQGLKDFIKQSIEEGKNNGLEISVMFIDLDRFKIVNDTMGHDFGDILLQQAAERLKQSIRQEDFLSRYGGDEFIIVLKDISLEEIHRVARRVINEFSHPFVIQNREVYTSPSIGISIGPSDSDDPETLIKYADTAMYLAKEQGRNTYCFYFDRINS